MKQYWLKFYNSRWFLPVLAILWLALGTAIIYFTFEHFHLWFAFLLILIFIVVIKIITFFLKLIFGRL